MGNKEDRNIIKDCKELISKEWNVTIKHIGREVNIVADRVSNWAAREEFGIFELLLPP